MKKLKPLSAGLLASLIATAAFATTWPPVNITGNQNRLTMDQLMIWNDLMAANEGAYHGYATFDAFVEYPQFFVASDLQPDSRCNQTIKNITGTTTGNSDANVQIAKAQQVINSIKQTAGTNVGWFNSMPTLSGYYGPNGTFAMGKGFTLVWANGSSTTFVLTYGSTAANPVIDKMVSGTATPPAGQSTGCSAVS